MASESEESERNMFATTRDGIRIGYTIFGNADAPKKVALVHSLAMDRTFWQPVAEDLAKDAAILVIDCRGHGVSDKPEGPYSVDQFADDLAGKIPFPVSLIATQKAADCPKGTANCYWRF
jgi:pimeloyl-ACP methyl ester carboxylesterase